MNERRERPNYRLYYYSCFYDRVGFGSHFTQRDFYASSDEDARKNVKELVEKSPKIGRTPSTLISSVHPVSLERIIYELKEVETTTERISL